MKRKVQKNIRNYLKEQGITLVALVVTIIVLLILAGVTISMATSGSGIFGRAKNGVNVYRESARNENTVMNSYINEINKVINEDNGDDKPEISTKISYVGYYADVDSDGIVDGIIYADMAKGNTRSGNWNPGDSENTFGRYTIPTKKFLNSYYISQAEYNGKFGTNAVISSINKGNSTYDKDRFYVMALKDIDGSDDFDYSKHVKHTWYNSAIGNMRDYSTYTFEDFGKGRENTQKMITKWNEAGYGSKDTSGGIHEGSNECKDLWGQIQNKVDAGWFIPSREELATFAGELNMQRVNSASRYYFANLGLGSVYWSSSQYNEYSVWAANFANGYMYSEGVPSAICVRLSTTF